MMTGDLHFTDHGSLWLMEPRTEAGKAWVAQHIPEGARWGNGVAIDPRSLEYVVMDAMGDGLVCENLRPN